MAPMRCATTCCARSRATGDGDFSLERLARAYNADLADQLGNLLSRTVGMISRYYGGVVPTPGELEEADRRLVEAGEQLYQRIDAALEQFALDAALGAIWDLVAIANKYVVEVQPWALAKQRADPAIERRLATTLYNLVETLRLVAHALAAFLPATAEAIARQLGIALDSGDGSARGAGLGALPGGHGGAAGGGAVPEGGRGLRNHRFCTILNA